MLLTLTTSMIRNLVAPRRGKPKMDLLDTPQFAHETLGLRGLHLTTDLLVGITRDRLEELRERADKVGCACLLLIEPEAQPFADRSQDKGDGAIERTHRVLQAAHLLGCNAAAIRIAGQDNDDAFARAVERLKHTVERAERLEINLLIAPTKGLTARPDRLTDLIKAIGRFRVMTYPDFALASQTEDPVAYLRRLTPYAGAVCASTLAFECEGTEADWERLATGPIPHVGYDLTPLVKAVRSVGFDGALGIDYRGKGDATLGAMMSRSVLEAALLADDD